MNDPQDDADFLTNAGWIGTEGGWWTHPDLAASSPMSTARAIDVEERKARRPLSEPTVNDRRGTGKTDDELRAEAHERRGDGSEHPNRLH